MGADKNDDLFPDVRNPQGTRLINERCLLRTQDGHCVVLVSGIVLAQYAATDLLAQTHAMVSLVDQGWASAARPPSSKRRRFRRTVRTEQLKPRATSTWLAQPWSTRLTIAWVCASKSVAAYCARTIPDTSTTQWPSCVLSRQRSLMRRVPCGLRTSGKRSSFLSAPIVGAA